MNTWIPKSIGMAVEEAGQLYPEWEFLVVHDQRITYQELSRRIKQFSRGLLAVGVKPGEKVAIWLPNGIEWVVAVFSLANIGAIFVPVNTRFKADELEYILQQSDSTTFILSDRFQKTEYLEIFRQLCPELYTSQPGGLHSPRIPGLRTIICVSEKALPGAYSFQRLYQMGSEINLKPVEDAVGPHQTVSILYTSGSTAFPKGVMLTHNNILRNGFEIGERLGLNAEDRYFNPCPYYHNAGLVDGLLAALTHGSCNVTLSSFDARESLAVMERERCTAVGGIQTMYVKMMEEPGLDREKLSLRTGWTTGPPQTVRDIYEKMGVSGITNLYGISEASPCCSISDCLHDSLEDRMNRMGKPLPGVEMKIITPQTGEPLSPNEKGEICVRGWNLMQGYYNKPEETAKAIDSEGWLHTGDLGFIDEKGLVFFMGRIKNVVRSGGENISPEEVENFIFRHPKVKHVEIVGLADEKWGQRVVACIELKDGMEATSEEIIGFCKERMANFKVPKEVHFVTDWPMTGSGKVQKFRLVESLLEKQGKK
ncbi:MAG: AMP-binding protein [Thermodesulfobacteriota bacterium]|nr:AMP-binding protein [Thermodesulfobacteriota bacterium]